MPFFLAGLCHLATGVKKLSARALVVLGLGSANGGGRGEQPAAEEEDRERVDRCRTLLQPPLLPALVAALGDVDTGVAQARTFICAPGLCVWWCAVPSASGRSTRFWGLNVNGGFLYTIVSGDSGNSFRFWKTRVRELSSSCRIHLMFPLQDAGVVRILAVLEVDVECGVLRACIWCLGWHTSVQRRFI